MANTKVAKVEETPAPAHPLAMLAAAIDKGQTPETIEKLMDLAERWEAREARKEFEAAMNAAQAAFAPMTKSGTGHNRARYYTLGDIRQAVAKALGDNGLSFRWRTEAKEGRIAVTCVLAHRNGHFQEVTLEAGNDSSGSKNAIQALGSAQTYLQRYTLMAALGLSSGENEDDGAAAGVTISESQYTDLAKAIEAKGVPEQRVLDRYGIAALYELPAAKFDDCKQRVAAFKANGAANA